MLMHFLRKLFPCCFPNDLVIFEEESNYYNERSNYFNERSYARYSPTSSSANQRLSYYID